MYYCIWCSALVVLSVVVCSWVVGCVHTLSNFYLNMFRASLCPSSGDQDRVLLHMVFCTGCAGCGCVQLGRRLCG